jgi:hypothetical protein
MLAAAVAVAKFGIGDWHFRLAGIKAAPDTLYAPAVKHRKP